LELFRLVLLLFGAFTAEGAGVVALALVVGVKYL